MEYPDTELLFHPFSAWIRELWNNREWLRLLMKPRNTEDDASKKKKKPTGKVAKKPAAKKAGKVATKKPSGLKTKSGKEGSRGKVAGKAAKKAAAR